MNVRQQSHPKYWVRERVLPNHLPIPHWKGASFNAYTIHWNTPNKICGQHEQNKNIQARPSMCKGANITLHIRPGFVYVLRTCHGVYHIRCDVYGWGSIYLWVSRDAGIRFPSTSHHALKSLAFFELSYANITSHVHISNESAWNAIWALIRFICLYFA